MTGPIAAEASLESQSLRAVIRIEVLPAHHAFFGVSPLFDQRTVAEESLPIALATVAPQMLRRILEEAESRLQASISDACSSGFSLVKTPVIAPAPDNSTTGG